MRYLQVNYNRKTGINFREVMLKVATMNSSTERVVESQFIAAKFCLFKRKCLIIFGAYLRERAKRLPTIKY